jgi:hypothetical protein
MLDENRDFASLGKSVYGGCGFSRGRPHFVIPSEARDLLLASSTQGKADPSLRSG